VNLITIVEPTVEPITLEEVYLHLRMDPLGSPPTHPDDTMLASMITTARTRAEQVTRRAFVQQTVRLVQPGFPVRSFGMQWDDEPWQVRDGWLELYRPPFTEVVQVRYYDTDNVIQTLAAENYFVTEESFVPRLMAAEGISWPATYCRDDAVQIDYVVGYDPDGSPPSDYRANVPEQIKDAIKIGVQLLYDELAPEKRDQLEQTFQRLLASFRVHTF
jgi:uncharacterized phiE125 gp8 family phage protein